MTTSIITRAAFGAALAAGLLFGAPAQAQDGARPQRTEQGQRARPDRVARLTERLQLSADQATRIRAILDQERQQMQALRPARAAGDSARGRRPQGERPRGDRAQGQRQQGQRGQARPDSARRQVPPAVLQLRQRTEQQIEAVLNEGQRTQYRALKAEMESRRGEHRGRGRGERGGREERGRRPAADSARARTQA
jgi:hypothetical protein